MLLQEVIFCMDRHRLEDCNEFAMVSMDVYLAAMDQSAALVTGGVLSYHWDDILAIGQP